jgi:hypothetical protein
LSACAGGVRGASVGESDIVGWLRRRQSVVWQCPKDTTNHCLPRPTVRYNL